MQKVRRIISARTAARRLEISRTALGKHVRRGLVQPDYQSDSGYFFDPSSLPAMRRAIEQNRLNNWRYTAKALH